VNEHQKSPKRIHVACHKGLPLSVHSLIENTSVTEMKKKHAIFKKRYGLLNTGWQTRGLLTKKCQQLLGQKLSLKT
jgi:hypothetical protein